MSESLRIEAVPHQRSPEAVERIREYFDLQLMFAEAVAAKTGEPIDEAVLKYTNFHRRFGFGKPKNLDPRWTQFASTIRAAATHEDRLKQTLAVYAQTKWTESSHPEREFGCFSYDYDPKTKIVHIHFNTNDPLGPLKKERMPERIKDLTEMFAYIRKTHPEAEIVEGRSWLYNLDAYRRLMPEEYVKSRKPVEHVDHFQGSSRWGQFLRHDGKIKQDLKQKFIENFENIDPDNLEKTFPFNAFDVRAPIKAFYKKFGIEA